MYNQSRFNNSPQVWAYRRRHQRRNDTNTIKIIRHSIGKISKEYCAESSICGLKHLVDSKTTWIERIIWIITLIGALICSISLVWMTFTKYYRSPLVTTQMPEGVSVNKIIFPAVGICTNNRISRRAVTALAKELLKEERNKKYNETQILSLLIGLGQLYNPLSFYNIDSFEVHNILGTYDVNDLLESLTPKCSDIMVRCSWNEKTSECMNLFDFRLTTSGYCCTFNYLRESDIMFETFYSENTIMLPFAFKCLFLTAFGATVFSNKSGSRSIDMYNYGNKSSFDYDQGLKTLLRLDEIDDFYYLVPIQGAQLQFSDAYDFPDAPSGSFAIQMISPNVKMTVMLTASFTTASRDIQHIPVKLRQCLFYDESPYLSFYTHSDCMVKCRMLFLLEKCNCTPFNIPKLDNVRTCDLKDVSCLRRYVLQSTNVRPESEVMIPELELDMVGGGISCPMCYPTCSKTAYSYDFNNVDIYPEHLNVMPDYEMEDWLMGANFTATSLVHVKYSSEVADCYGQNVIMKWFDLISNIGSTCGFVTGFSFVSVLEFIYFFTVKLARDVVTRRRQQNRMINRFGTHSPRHFASITKYRSIYWNELAAS